MEAQPRLLAFVLFALAGAAVGCSSDDPAPKTPKPPATATPEARVFTGLLDGSDARMAVVATAHHARLYFCGGDSSFTSLSRWVTADIGTDGHLSPDASAMGWSVDAVLDDREVTGTLTPDDAGALTFHALPVALSTIAGVYEGTSPCGKVGLIVTQDSKSDEPTGQGACIGNGNIDIHQVNPVLPLARDADGMIRVVVAGSPGDVSVTPAAAPAN